MCIRDRAKGTHKKLLEDLKKEGFVRVRVDGTMAELEDDIVLDKNKKHTIEVVVDKMCIRDSFRVRGDTVEIFPASSSENAIRVEFFGDEIDRITEINTITCLLYTSQKKLNTSSWTGIPQKDLLLLQETRLKLMNGFLPWKTTGGKFLWQHFMTQEAIS